MNEQITVKRLADGVDGRFIRSGRFKTERISVTAYLPLEKRTAAALSLMSQLISNGCARHPSPMDMSRRLDTLYGASVGADTDKLGDMLTVRAGIIFVGDRFLPDSVFGDCSQLLFDMLFDPAADEGGFLESNFRREQRLLTEEIENEINDKIVYSRNRCLEEMFRDEPFGIPVHGTAEEVKSLTRREVYDAWREMLASAHFCVTVTADRPHDEVYADFLRALERAGRHDIFRPNGTGLHEAAGEVREVTDRMQVAQGKLVMGFSFGGGEDSVSFPEMVTADILGGGPYSLLFANVREKMSLCYYCSARAIRRKGVMLISSGVEFGSMDKTYEAVLDQINDLKNGNFGDEMISASKLSITGALKGVYDSQAVTDRWYSDRLFDNEPLSPEELAERISAVTREDIIRAASRIRLDTVYRLTGKD